MSFLKARFDRSLAAPDRRSNPSASADRPVSPAELVVSFTEPMRIAGTALLPGRYVFCLLDPGTNRNVVQILKEDSGELIATFTALPAP